MISNNNFDFPSGLQVTMRRFGQYTQNKRGQSVLDWICSILPLTVMPVGKIFGGAGSKGWAESVLLGWNRVN